MASSFRKKILSASSLGEVFDLIVQDSNSSGALQITAGEVKGTVAYAQGRLVGAYISKSGESGTEALNKLLLLREPKVRYTTFDEESLSALSDAERVDIDLRQLMQSLKFRQAEKLSSSYSATEQSKTEDALTSTAAIVAEKAEPAEIKPDAITTVTTDSIDTEVKAAEPVQSEAAAIETVQPEAPSVETVQPEAAAIEPVQPEAAAIEPVQPEAAAIEPVQPEATSVEPVQSEAVAIEPVQPEATGIEPVQPEATSVEPVQSEAVAIEPVQPEATGIEPVQPEATGIEPVQPEATSVEPVQPEATSVEPVQSEAATIEPVQPEATSVEPVQSEAATIEPVQPEATSVEPVQSEAATIEPVQPEAAAIETVQPEATSIEPVQPEAAAIETVQPEATSVEPVQSEAAAMEPVQSEAAAMEPVQSEAAAMEPVQSEATSVEPGRSEVATTDSNTQPISIEADNLLDAVFGVPEFASEDGLTPEKRKLLHHTSEHMQDEELFNQSDSLLESLDAEIDFSAAKIDLLAVTPLDHKPFDETEKILKHDDLPSLTDEQRKLLTIVEAEAHDLETFEQLDEFLQDKGIDLTAQQLADLRQGMALRTSDEQQQEFQRSDKSLQFKETTDFRDFVEPVVPEPGSVEDLNAIPAPKIIDADRTPMALLAEQDGTAARKEKTGLLGEVDPSVKFRLGVSTGERLRARKEYPIGKIMGVVTISVLCVGIFTLPAAIKSSATNLSSEGLQESVLNLAIKDEIKEDVPTVQLDEAVQGAMPVGHVAVGSGSADNDSVVGSVQNDPLAYAGMLVSEGKTASAIPWYQDYIKHNPNAVAARVQLIRCLIALKQPAKARLVCIETLKLKLSDAELNSVWGLMRSCLTD